MMQLRRTEFMGEKLSTQVQNQAGSTYCISRLTKTIICNIYYERRLLPEINFVTRVIEGIPVKDFAPEGRKNPRVVKLEEWVQDLIKSIEKKELKNIFLELFHSDKNRLIETYSVKYSYRDEKTAKKIPEQTTSSNIQTMLKNMKNVFKNQLNPLNDLHNLRFRMTADTTGAGKKSCTFSRGKQFVLNFEPDENNVEIEMGTVHTPFHRLILKVKADIKQTLDDNDENDVIIIEENSQKDKDDDIEIIELDDDDDCQTVNYSVNTTPEPDPETSSSKQYSTILELSNVKISCICATQIRDNLFTIIQCKNCSTYQHAECYGIRKLSNIPGRHLCHDCSCLLIDTFGKTRSPATGKLVSQENDNHTDPRLVEFTIGELRDIGQMRLVLIYIYREKKIPINFIRQYFSRKDGEKMIDKLLLFKVLIEKDEKLIINVLKMNYFVHKHFKPKYPINKYF